MKATMVKKLNTIVSLWLIAIIGALIVFGYQLNMFGFYIAAIVVAAILLVSNIVSITAGILSIAKLSKEQETEYRKY